MICDESHRWALFIFLSNFILFLSLISSSSGAGWKIQGAITLVQSIKNPLKGANNNNSQNQVDNTDNAWDPAVKIIKSCNK